MLRKSSISLDLCTLGADMSIHGPETTNKYKLTGMFLISRCFQFGGFGQQTWGMTTSVWIDDLGSGLFTFLA
jgi:hypothetical protein